MAWNMQIRASRSWSSNTSEDQPGPSPTSSSTPAEYAELHEYLKEHVQKAMDCLGALTMDETTSPISPKTPFDRVFVANIDCCQQGLTWDHLPDDIWTDDIEQWLHETTQQAIEVHPAPTTCAETSRWSSSTTTSSKGWRRPYPSFSLPVFTDIQWQRSIEQYSPSIYSQDSSAVSPGHLTNAARNLMQEMPLSPTQYISMNDILDLAGNIADVCIELRATINRAEDSAEFDNSDADSDVSMFDLVEPLPTPAITFYDIARARGLTISDSISPSSDGGSNHSSIDGGRYRSNASGPSEHSRTTSASSRPQSYLRVRARPLHHNISPGIRNRMECLAKSGLTIQLPPPRHNCALPADGTGVTGEE